MRFIGVVLCLVAGCRGSTNALSDASEPDTTIVVDGMVDAPSVDGGLVELTPIVGGELAWAKQAGGNSYDKIEDIAHLPDGSVLVTGRYSSAAAVFGAGETNQVTLPAPPFGEYDVFVAKYAPDGTVAYARRVASGPTANDDVGVEIVALADGSAIVAGTYEITTTVGIGDPNETTLSGGTGDEVFLARFGPTGALVWARDVGIVQAYGLAGKPDGTTVVVGDGGVVRYSADGTATWTRPLGLGARPTAATMLADDSVVVAGWFETPTVFGAGEATETTLTPSGTLFYQFDAFIAKYDASGMLLWARRAAIGSDTSEEINSIEALPDGSFVVAGQFGRTRSTTCSATFAPDTANATTLACRGLDIFLARYTPAGELDWVRRGTGAGNEFGMSVDALPDGTLALTGFFGVFGSTTVTLEGTTKFATVPNASTMTSYVAKYTGAGELVWVRSIAGSVRDEADNVSLASDGSVVVTGMFENGQTTFGAGETNQTVLTPVGQHDIFIAKLQP